MIDSLLIFFTSVPCACVCTFSITESKSRQVPPHISSSVFLRHLLNFMQKLNFIKLIELIDESID